MWDVPPLSPPLPLTATLAFPIIIKIILHYINPTSFLSFVLPNRTKHSQTQLTHLSPISHLSSLISSSLSYQKPKKTLETDADKADHNSQFFLQIPSLCLFIILRGMNIFCFLLKIWIPQCSWINFCLKTVASKVDEVLMINQQLLVWFVTLLLKVSVSKILLFSSNSFFLFVLHETLNTQKYYFSLSLNFCKKNPSIYTSFHIQFRITVNNVI